MEGEMVRMAGVGALVLFVVACGEEGGGVQVVDADQLRLEIVSGADQTAQVNIGTTTGTLAEPIVARVTDGEGNVLTGSAARDGGLTGVSDLQMPVGTFVTFAVSDPVFGAPDNVIGIPDDTGFVNVEWIKGARAGTSCMDLHLRVGADSLDTRTVCATFEPGPPVAGLGWDSGVSTACTNCTRFDGNAAPWPQDGNGNRIQWRFAVVGAPAHAQSDNVDENGARVLVADSQGVGGLQIITVRADTSDGVLEVGTSTAGTPFMRLNGWTPR